MPHGHEVPINQTRPLILPRDFRDEAPIHQPRSSFLLRTCSPQFPECVEVRLDNLAGGDVQGQGHLQTPRSNGEHTSYPHIVRNLEGKATSTSTHSVVTSCSLAGMPVVYIPHTYAQRCLYVNSIIADICHSKSYDLQTLIHTQECRDIRILEGE